MPIEIITDLTNFLYPINHIVAGKKSKVEMIKPIYLIIHTYSIKDTTSMKNFFGFLAKIIFWDASILKEKRSCNNPAIPKEIAKNFT